MARGRDLTGAAALDAGTGLQQALVAVSRTFTQAGIPDAQTDARFLLQGLIGIDAAVFLTDPERRLGADAAAIADAVQRRLAGEPVSRILGRREFFGRVFRITPDVLDPRPETETLVDAVLEVLKRRGRDGAGLTIADIGSGSGAIVVTLLAELPGARGIATDVSRQALAVTQENAERLGVAGRLKVFETRGLKGVGGGSIDIVVSNPPYIARGDIAGLEAGVRDFDPWLALDGGVDGLDVYREICQDIIALKSSCSAFLEVGAGQAADVEALFERAGGRPIGRWRDLGGKERVVAVEIHC